MKACLEEAVKSWGETNLTTTLTASFCEMIQVHFDFVCRLGSDAFISSRSIVAPGRILVGKDTLKQSVLKISLPGHEALHENEVKVMNKIKCEAVPAVLATWKLEDGTRAFAMPWYSLCLFDAIAEQKVSRMLAWRVLAAVSRALLRAHALGVTHCDVKSENVFMEDSSGRGCVLGDWDLACDGTQLEMKDHKTGTVDYNPPPSLGLSHVSFAADKYRLGVLMFVMMFATVPVWNSAAALTCILASENFVCVSDAARDSQIFYCRKFEVIMLRLMRQGDLPDISLMDVYGEALENIFKH